MSETRLQPTMEAKHILHAGLAVKRKSTGNSASNSAVLEAVFSKKQQ